MTLMDVAKDYRYKIWLKYRVYFYTRKQTSLAMMYKNRYKQLIKAYDQMHKAYEAYKKQVLEP